MKTKQQVINRTKRWVEKVVIGLNLCPFAKRELVKQRLHFSVSQASTEEDLLFDLQEQLTAINNSEVIETTLLIHPNVLEDFAAYNQFLDYADALLVQMNLDGVYQIASFHPAYQFADLEPDDVRNYTNKSPYPMLHLLGEESVAIALADYQGSDEIPQRNQELLLGLGKDKMLALQQSCFDDKA